MSPAALKGMVTMETHTMRTILAAVTLAAMLWAAPAAQAAEPALRMANILTDNMVLQRGKPVRIWGWATVGAKVKVTITEDAKLAAPIVAKAPKMPPVVIESKRQVPPPAEGEYHVTLRYAEHNAKLFATVSKTATAAGDGAWEVEFPAMPASFVPKSILAESGDQAAAVSNVLIGIVWLNTGQSNIQRKGFNGSDLELPSARLSGIRYCKVDGSWYKPLEDLSKPAQWLICSPQTAGEMPGVSYYFALYLHRYVNVPVGIINNARGGTTGQAWCSREALEGIDGPVYKALLPAHDAACKPWESEAYRKKIRAEQVAAAQAVIDEYEEALAAYNKLSDAEKADRKNRKPKPPKLKATKALRVTEVMGDAREGWSPPAGLFNAVVYPLRKLHVEGMLYYQGENNNFGLWSRYELTFPRVIASHRALFNDPNMPIGIVGLPGWKQVGTDPEVATVADGYAIIRDIHNRTAAGIDGVDVIHTYDLGGPGIHPGDKEPVGRRSARWALATVYGKDLFHRGPILRDMKHGANKAGRKVIKLYFTVDPFVQKMMDQSRAKRPDGPPSPAYMTLPVPRKSWPTYEGFIIAGQDRRWYPADVVRNKEPALEISSRFVDEPVAVRYAWGNRPDGNAVGFREMPLPSFRTDDWPLPISWKYDKALAGAGDQKIKKQIALGRKHASERKMAERMIELSELDAERFLGKAEKNPRGLFRSKAARIAAVIADIKRTEAELFRRRGGNPEIDKKLATLEAALRGVEAEIDKLGRE